MRRLYACLAMAAALSLPAACQATFNVASVKLHRGAIRFSQDPTPKGNRVTAVAVTPLELIAAAYNLHDFQVTGAPAWAQTERYDLVATAPTVLTVERMRLVLQELLAGRFRLRSRMVKKSRSVLALQRDGPDLKLLPPSPQGKGWAESMDAGGTHLRAQAMTIPQLADLLSATLMRPVVDQTRLAGAWAFALDWSPTIDEQPPGGTESPDIHAALKGLGLRLESARSAVSVLVVEGLERPTPN